MFSTQVTVAKIKFISCHCWFCVIRSHNCSNFDTNNFCFVRFVFFYCTGWQKAT